jgi:hypothetical protein
MLIHAAVNLIVGFLWKISYEVFDRNNIFKYYSKFPNICRLKSFIVHSTKYIKCFLASGWGEGEAEDSEVDCKSEHEGGGRLCITGRKGEGGEKEHRRREGRKRANGTRLEGGGGEWEVLDTEGMGDGR